MATLVESLLSGLSQALNLESAIARIERMILRHAFGWKRAVFRSGIEIALILLSIIFLGIGFILFLQRFIAVDYAFLLIGSAFLLIALTTTKLR